MFINLLGWLITCFIIKITNLFINDKCFQELNLSTSIPDYVVNIYAGLILLYIIYLLNRLKLTFDF